VSGIAGIYNLDGQPVDRALLTRMTDAIAHRGPDGIRHWVSGEVSLGHCMLQTTPESLYETQPLTDETGALCLTMDGRVDNREELLDALESAGVRLRDDTDAELVLKSYECWGTECPRRIIGDFVFAIWDGRERQLFCARDPLGNKPFTYYWDGGRRFMWGSELHQILEDANVPREPNEGMVAEYLSVRMMNAEETLYKGILRLPASHFLLIRNGQLTKRQYWDVDPEKQIRYSSDDEYADHFREVFKEAVRCRLRSHAPVGSQLSGGLDSSSIVCMAQEIYRQGLTQDRGFETFSMVYPGLPCDESEYIRAVVEHADLRANYMRLMDPQPEWLIHQVRVYKDICDYPNGTQSDPTRSLAREKGCRVLLTGMGGDERVFGNLHYLADFVRQGRARALLQEFRLHDLRLASKRGMWTLLRYAVVPAFPNSVRMIMKSIRQRARGWRGSMDWISPEFARRVNLKARVDPNTSRGPCANHCQALLYGLLTNGGQFHGMEIEDRSASWFGLEQRHPFRDRRMVDLSFALPENQRFRRYQKFVLRQAMRGCLPEVVRQRRDKTAFPDVMVRALDSIGGELLSRQLCIEDLGWVNGRRLRTMYEELKPLHEAGSRAAAYRAWPLWMACALELWCKAIFTTVNKTFDLHSGVAVMAAR